MKRIVETIARHSVLCAAVVVAATVYPLLQLPKLAIDNSIEVWLRRDSSEYRVYREFKERHGTDEFILIAVSGGDILSPAKREVMDRIATDLGELADVERVTSVSQVPEFMLDDFENLLISGDRTVGGILIGCGSLEEKTARQQLVSGVNDVLDRHKGALEFYLGGPPVVNAALDATSEREAGVFFPVAFVISVVILLLTTRSVTATLIPVISAAVTVIWTLGVMACCGRSFNMVTLVIPTLLWVLSLSNCIHLIHTCRRMLAAGATRGDALRRTLSTLVVPCFMASFTTAIGFSTLSASHMIPVRDLGLFSAMGIMISFIVNMTVTPGLLMLLARRAGSADGGQPAHRRTVAIVSLLFVTASASMIVFLKVESNVLKFFRDDAAIVRDYRFISSHLSGLSTIEVEAMADGEGNVLNQQEFVNAFVEDIEKHRDVSGVRTGDDGLSTRVSVFVNAMESRAFNEVVMRTKEAVQRHRRDGVSVVTTGTVVLLNGVQQELIDTQVRSFSLAFVMIFLVLTIMFRSFKVMVVSLLPNLFPVFATFGIMSAFSIPLDTATITIASIAMGIAVDDTIHFLARIRAEARTGVPLERAVCVAFSRAAPPIVFTSLVIASGFFALCFAEFRPLMLFGVLSGTAMLTALVGDLVVLPALVLLTKPRFRKYDE